MIAKIVALILILTATPVFAQESERVRQLEQDVHLLKSTVVEQGRRIDVLEREIGGKSSAVAPKKESAVQSQSSVSTGNSWHDLNTWGRVKDGMSESQVMSILGRPTSVENIGPYRTLFYRGEVSGSGSVSGNIKLSDDRVWQVNAPVF